MSILYDLRRFVSLSKIKSRTAVWPRKAWAAVDICQRYVMTLSPNRRSSATHGIGIKERCIANTYVYTNLNAHSFNFERSRYSCSCCWVVAQKSAIKTQLQLNDKTIAWWISKQSRYWKDVQVYVSCINTVWSQGAANQYWLPLMINATFYFLKLGRSTDLTLLIVEWRRGWNI